MSETKVDPLTNWNGFFKEIQNESPRASVIIASAFLDNQLRELIANSLIDDIKAVNELIGSDDEANPPLSSFSSRIKMAYCMGLISKGTYNDLNIIRKIRNKFAHKMHGYTFNEPEIVNWCKSLKLAKMIADVLPHVPKTHGDLFILGVTQLVMQLEFRIFESSKTHRSSPNDPEIAQAVNVDASKNGV